MHARELCPSALHAERNDRRKLLQGTAPQQPPIAGSLDTVRGCVADPSKAETLDARPCGVTDHTQGAPPEAHTLRREPWSIPDQSVYRYTAVAPAPSAELVYPQRNISPRQTFQENMRRVMFPSQSDLSKIVPDPTSPTVSFPLQTEQSISKNVKMNLPNDSKYCDVPYLTNPVMKQHRANIVRNSEVYSSGAGRGWPPSAPAPAFYPPEYCSAPHGVAVSRSAKLPLEKGSEELPQVLGDSMYRGGPVRYEPYPSPKDKYPRNRYEYINFPNSSQPYLPTSHKYDSIKPAAQPPYINYTPQKYVDPRIVDPHSDAYARPNQHSRSFNPIHPGDYISAKFVPPTAHYPIQSKFYSYPVDNGLRHSHSAVKTPYDIGRPYYEYDYGRIKPIPMNDNHFISEIPAYSTRPQFPIHNYQLNNGQPRPTNYLYHHRSDSNSLRTYPEHLPQYKLTDIRQNMHNPLARIPAQFSPNIISPSESNTSTESVPALGTPHEDCGYASQGSTASGKSFDFPHFKMHHDSSVNDNRSYVSLPSHNMKKPKQCYQMELNNDSASIKDKNINVRQFLQMWDEHDEDDLTKTKVAVSSVNPVASITIEPAAISTEHQQLYVLDLVNIPNEEVDKYGHIQKVCKLPENIRGYDSADLLNKFDEAFHPSVNTSIQQDSKAPTKASIIGTARPPSPFDVEAKITQSVIHKDVGCNFEIKPCSPPRKNMDSLHAIIEPNERKIEKLINQHIGLSMGTNSLHPNDDADKNTVKCGEKRRSPSRDTEVTSSKVMKTLDSICNVRSDELQYKIDGKEYGTVSKECLASLPRLDNEMEYFTEINQQYCDLKSNQESVITISANNALITHENLNSSLSAESCRDIPPNLSHDMALSTKNTSNLYNTQVTACVVDDVPNENNSRKLSKFRRPKYALTENKEETLTQNLQLSESPQLHNLIQRTNSVIMKTPESLEVSTPVLDDSASGSQPLQSIENKKSKNKSVWAQSFTKEVTELKDPNEEVISNDFSGSQKAINEVFSLPGSSPMNLIMHSHGEEYTDCIRPSLIHCIGNETESTDVKTKSASIDQDTTFITKHTDEYSKKSVNEIPINVAINLSIHSNQSELYSSNNNTYELQKKYNDNIFTPEYDDVESQTDTLLNNGELMNCNSDDNGCAIINTNPILNDPSNVKNKIENDTNNTNLQTLLIKCETQVCDAKVEMNNTLSHSNNSESRQLVDLEIINVSDDALHLKKKSSPNQLEGKDCSFVSCNINHETTSTEVEKSELLQPTEERFRMDVDDQMEENIENIALHIMATGNIFSKTEEKITSENKIISVSAVNENDNAIHSSHFHGLNNTYNLNNLCEEIPSMEYQNIKKETANKAEITENISSNSCIDDIFYLNFKCNSETKKEIDISKNCLEDAEEKYKVNELKDTKTVNEHKQKAEINEKEQHKNSCESLNVEAPSCLKIINDDLKIENPKDDIKHDTAEHIFECPPECVLSSHSSLVVNKESLNENLDSVNVSQIENLKNDNISEVSNEEPLFSVSSNTIKTSLNGEPKTCVNVKCEISAPSDGYSIDNILYCAPSAEEKYEKNVLIQTDLRVMDTNILSKQPFGNVIDKTNVGGGIYLNEIKASMGENCGVNSQFCDALIQPNSESIIIPADVEVHDLLKINEHDVKSATPVNTLSREPSPERTFEVVASQTQFENNATDQTNPLEKITDNDNNNEIKNIGNKNVSTPFNKIVENDCKLFSHEKMSLASQVLIDENVSVRGKYYSYCFQSPRNDDLVEKTEETFFSSGYSTGSVDQLTKRDIEIDKKFDSDSPINNCDHLIVEIDKAQESLKDLEMSTKETLKKNYGTDSNEKSSKCEFEKQIDHVEKDLAAVNLAENKTVNGNYLNFDKECSAELNTSLYKSLGKTVKTIESNIMEEKLNHPNAIVVSEEITNLFINQVDESECQTSISDKQCVGRESIDLNIAAKVIEEKQYLNNGWESNVMNNAIDGSVEFKNIAYDGPVTHFLSSDISSCPNSDETNKSIIEDKFHDIDKNSICEGESNDEHVFSNPELDKNTTVFKETFLKDCIDEHADENAGEVSKVTQKVMELSKIIGITQNKSELNCTMDWDIIRASTDSKLCFEENFECCEVIFECCKNEAESSVSTSKKSSMNNLKRKDLHSKINHCNRLYNPTYINEPKAGEIVTDQSDSNYDKKDYNKVSKLADLEVTEKSLVSNICTINKSDEVIMDSQFENETQSDINEIFSESYDGDNDQNNPNDKNNCNSIKVIDGGSYNSDVITNTNQILNKVVASTEDVIDINLTPVSNIKESVLFVKGHQKNVGLQSLEGSHLVLAHIEPEVISTEKGVYETDNLSQTMATDDYDFVNKYKKGIIVDTYLEKKDDTSLLNSSTTESFISTQMSLITQKNRDTRWDKKNKHILNQIATEKVVEESSFNSEQNVNGNLEVIKDFVLNKIESEINSFNDHSNRGELVAGTNSIELSSHLSFIFDNLSKKRRHSEKVFKVTECVPPIQFDHHPSIERTQNSKNKLFSPKQLAGTTNDLCVGRVSKVAKLFFDDKESENLNRRNLLYYKDDTERNINSETYLSKWRNMDCDSLKKNLSSLVDESKQNFQSTEKCSEETYEISTLSNMPVTDIFEDISEKFSCQNTKTQKISLDSENIIKTDYSSLNENSKRDFILYDDMWPEIEVSVDPSNETSVADNYDITEKQPAEEGVTLKPSKCIPIASGSLPSTLVDEEEFDIKHTTEKNNDILHSFDANDSAHMCSNRKKEPNTIKVVLDYIGHQNVGEPLENIHIKFKDESINQNQNVDNKDVIPKNSRDISSISNNIRYEQCSGQDESHCTSLLSNTGKQNNFDTWNIDSMTNYMEPDSTQECYGQTEKDAHYEVNQLHENIISSRHNVTEIENPVFDNFETNAYAQRQETGHSNVEPLEHQVHEVSIELDECDSSQTSISNNRSIFEVPHSQIDSTFLETDISQCADDSSVIQESLFAKENSVLAESESLESASLKNNECIAEMEMEKVLAENEGSKINVVPQSNSNLSETLLIDGCESSQDDINIEYEDIWIDDVACVETVVSEEATGEDSENEDYASQPLAEEVVPIIAPVKNESEYSDFKCGFNFYSTKMKDIYGNNMDNHGMNLVETLYRTPYIDVQNKLNYPDCFSNIKCTDANEVLKKDNQVINFKKNATVDGHDSNENINVIKQLDIAEQSLNSMKVQKVNSKQTIFKYNCKVTNSNVDFGKSRKFITKAAQKYIPPLKLSSHEIKVKLPLPEERLASLKELKMKLPQKHERSPIPKLKINKFHLQKVGPQCYKKVKPKFEDVLKHIDDVQYSLNSKIRNKKKNLEFVPKVIIKKNENGSHYTSQHVRMDSDPDLTGSKWQPCVSLDKCPLIERMIGKGITLANVCYRSKQSLIKHSNYGIRYSISNVESQPPSSTQGAQKKPLKCTISLNPNCNEEYIPQGSQISTASRTYKPTPRRPQKNKHSAEVDLP